MPQIKHPLPIHAWMESRQRGSCDTVHRVRGFHGDSVHGVIYNPSMQPHTWCCPMGTDPVDGVIRKSQTTRSKLVALVSEGEAPPGVCNVVVSTGLYGPSRRAGGQMCICMGQWPGPRRHRCSTAAQSTVSYTATALGRIRSGRHKVASWTVWSACWGCKRGWHRRGAGKQSHPVHGVKIDTVA